MKSIMNNGISTLFTIKYTMSSLVSILHRVSGIFLFFLLLLFLFYVVHCAFSFKTVMFNFFLFSSSFIGKFFFHICFFFFLFHLLTGCRHILMDLGFFKSFHDAKITAVVVVVLSVLYVITVGFFYGF